MQKIQLHPPLADGSGSLYPLKCGFQREYNLPLLEIGLNIAVRGQVARFYQRAERESLGHLLRCIHP